MKVLVCGNINSGKSYCINAVSRLYSNFAVIQIDDYRRRYGNGLPDGEELARRCFIDAVSDADDAFVELSGMGPLGKALAANMEHKSFIILYVHETAGVCLQRIKDKHFSDTPYPKFSEAIEDTIKRLDKEFAAGELHNLWKDKAISIIDITSYSEVSCIPVMHYKYLCDVIARLKTNDYIHEIILYGSASRKTLTLLSDIDMFITTSLSTEEVVSFIKTVKGISFLDTTGNKITVYFGNILIEVVVVISISEHIKYYRTSNIQDIQSTIMKGTDNTYHELLSASNDYNTVNIEYLKREAQKRLMYFVMSLDNIAQKGDDYKFFFHNNIIIHEIVRLLYFQTGNMERDYLPLNALRYFEDADINISKLIYDFKKDKKQHIAIIKQYVSMLLKKTGCKESGYFEVLDVTA